MAFEFKKKKKKKTKTKTQKKKKTKTKKKKKKKMWLTDKFDGTLDPLSTSPGLGTGEDYRL